MLETTTTVPIRFTEVTGRVILDSRGWPTIEVSATLDDGTRVTAAAPAGASTGEHEAKELRDHSRAFGGRGVLAAVAGVNGEVSAMLTGRSWSDLAELDQALANLDGTAGYARLGANALVAVSTVAARAFAQAAGLELYQWIASQTGAEQRMPVPHFNVLNGGAHAANPLEFQEFMIAPVGARTEAQAVEVGAEVYHALAHLIQERFGSAGVGDEGGFAPPIADPRVALDLLVDAISASGHTAALDKVAIAIDPAANSFYLGGGRYRIDGLERGSEEMVEYYHNLIGSYPIRSLEDGFAESDTDGWVAMAEAASGQVQLVGDDLYVTDPVRIRDGAAQGYSNAVLIKPNQIGTVSQTFEAVKAAQDAGMACMVSHRSGETSDTFISDLAVGTGVGQIKSGAPARGERVAKYNRLTQIEADSPRTPYGLV